MKLIFCITFNVFLISSSAQAIVNNDTRKANYESAFQELKGMLEGNSKISFKRAVFITENAYFNNREDYNEFNLIIDLLARRCRTIAAGTSLTGYTQSDADNLKRNYSVFRLMTDTIRFYQNDSTYRLTIPYTYDFEDFWGDKDWSKMFVIKLLQTNKGNCHSLPFLYKILCEEIGTKAYLAMAPNHIYIKQYAKLGGWYNTELTSAQFPMDAWIMASGYVHLNAIQNGVYMDTLSLKQSIAVCVTDLAKGYSRIFPEDDAFIMACADLALKYYPVYTNALIMKSELLKTQFERRMKAAGVKYPSDLFGDAESKAVFDAMEQSYFRIHRLGYRMMPKKMYMDWLTDLKNNREQYRNKEMSSKFKTSTK